MFKIHCPHCQHKLSADATQSGATLQCPACGVDFVIPSPTDEVVIQPQSPEDSAEATASREIQPEQSRQPESSPEPGASHSFAERLRDGYKAAQEGAKFIKKGALVGWAGLKRRSKQAALKVQIEKLRNIDLRKPYHALGKSAFEQGILADELTERFQAIRDLDAKIAGHREKTSADAGETKMAALIRVSKDTAKSGQAQALTVKREHLITVLGREIHACKEQMSTGDLSDEFSAIDDIENRIRDKEDEVRGLNDGGKSGIQTLAVATVIGLLVIGAFYGMKMLGGGQVREKGADSNETVSEKKAPRESSAESHEFWRFRFGSTFSECAEIMKKLKNDGTFAELSSNNGDFIGWMSGSRNIDGTTSRGGEISMGGILSIPANHIELYFLKDKDALTAIKIRSYFRISAPPNAAEILANDMEKVFNTKSEYKIEEDEVGNKRQYYYLQKGSLTVTIVGGGKIEGTNHFTVPDVRIVVKDPPPPPPPKKNPVSMVPAVKEDNRADPDNPTTPAAQFLLGKKYQEGAGVRQDFAEAAKWYEKAAEQKEPESLYALALMHRQGQGVEKDENECILLLVEAANQGHHKAQFLLAPLYKGVLAYMWLDLAAASGDAIFANLAKKQRDNIARELTPEELAEAKNLSSKWKTGNPNAVGVFIRDVADKAKQRTPTAAQNGSALSSDDGDVEKLLRSKYPNDAKLRSRVAESLRLIMDKNRSVPLEAALETLERLSGGPLKDEADAAKVRVDIEQLFGAADRIGMSREDILKAALESQERVHLMTKDIWGTDSRSIAATRANEMVASAALAVKQEQVTANKSASLGIKLGPGRTLKQVLVSKENAMVHFLVNYQAITMLQGGGAANNPSTKERAQELLSDFEQTTNSTARRHLEIKARELIMEAEFGSPPSAKARRSKKQVIKFTPMPKNVMSPTLTHPQSAKTSVHASNLISHYKSIGFSEVEAKQFIDSMSDEKKYDAPKAMMLLAALYEGRTMFDVEKCMSWLYKAAEAGSADAMFRLHRILHPNFALSFLGYPEGDAKQSLDWAKKAAEHGDADGMNAMGYYHWYGEYETDGGELIMHPNKPQALVWWRKAAEAGSADAKAQIEKYRNGIPTTENKSAPSR